jgi:hypothetical protein
MQLVKLSDKLKPITIAAGMFTVGSSLTYADLDSFSGILTLTTSNKTTEYIRAVDKADDKYLIQKFRFQHHLKNWENKVMFLSSPNAIVENVDFKAIVNMGKSAVPFIVEEIERKPSSLVWALNFIYERKITDKPTATISEACKLWVKELKR